ncbi:lactate utilization protein C [Halobacillus sp. Marseille-Q1614]|uniref:LutC/YkgG family protein n=1 Tax=Halobacillus sp. Marseille-Q1614 TaxID=2709134 RepID=UPI00156EC783|nr:lactate utilization protein C [Halobacillus sp. Marseille-Q1614]
MAIHNRESFLDHVSESLGRPRKTEVTPPAYSVHPQSRVLAGATADELVDVLEKQCDVIHTTFKKTTTEGLSQTMKATLEDYGVRDIVAAGGPRTESAGLNHCYEILKHDGYNLHIWDENEGSRNLTIAERAGAGIVCSDLTLAESGTVTLFNDRYNGRSISLLPETFIAVIPKSTLVPRMTQAGQLIHAEEKKGNLVSSCVSFVTGPSNSADIEMNLIVGVHGPVKATYILVDDL